MTTQQENYIESRLEAYREELEDKDADWIQQKVEDALEDAEEKEGVRASEDLNLRSAAYDSHMEKFLEDTKKELEEHFKAISDEENDGLVKEYRQELEQELESEEE